MLCRNGNTLHEHSTVVESKICWGIIQRPTPPPPVIRPVTPAIEATTPKQIAYVGTLGGDQDYAAGLGKVKCSEYITELLAKGGRRNVDTRSPKSDFIIKNLLGGLPDGYFAVVADEGDTPSFLRISRPKHGNFKDAVKIQTIHGPNLQDAWTYYQTRDRLYVRHGAAPKIEQDIMLVFADWQAAAKRYAKIIGKCARCNLRLTDDRSRHYGIGPDCEKVWPSFIERVDEQEGGSFEYLRSVGKA